MKGKSRGTTRPRRRLRWLVIAAAVLAITAPFVIERRLAFFTDGRGVHAPEPLARESVRKVLWDPPRALDEEINDPALDDYEPRVSPDGDLLVFTRGRPGENAELWTSERVRGAWSPPRALQAVNSDDDEIGAAFSADGSWLLFASNRDGGAGGFDIWASRWLEDGWGDPRNLGASVNSVWNELSPAPSPGGDRFYFTSDRRADEMDRAPWRATIRARLHPANYDIYVASTSADDDPDTDGAFPAALRFDEAHPLAELNSARWAEGAVAVSPARDFLYFASNRPLAEPGDGERPASDDFDLYRVRLGPDGVRAPESLGPLVNSGVNELDPAVTSNGFQLYFSRERDGQEDIFVTTSREVYVTVERDGPYWSVAAVIAFLRDLIALLPPWLLIVILYLLFCALFLLFMRGRLGTINLLTRCLLLALLIHLLMAIWMNRNKVHRVLLEAMRTEELEDADFLEIAVDALPEETIGAAIRDAVAESDTSGAPGLQAPAPERRETAANAIDVAPRSVEPLRAAAAAEVPIERLETDLELSVADVEALSAAGPRDTPDPRRPHERTKDTEAPELAERVPERPPEPESDSAPTLANQSRERQAATVRAVARDVPFETTAVDVNATKASESASATRLPVAAVEETFVDDDLPAATAPIPRPSVSEVADVAAARPIAPPTPVEAEHATPSLSPRAPPRRSPRVGVTRRTNALVDPSIPVANVTTPVARVEGESRPSPSSLSTSSEIDPIDVAIAVAPPPRPVATDIAPALQPRARPGASTDRRPARATSADSGPRLASRRRRGPRRLGRPKPTRITSAVGPLPSSPDPIDGIRSERALDGDLANRLRPFADTSHGTPIEVARDAGSGSRESTSSFVPRIYRLRSDERRGEALRRGGGTSATERAVVAGLDWLALHQARDGRWTLDDYTRNIRTPHQRDLLHPDWSGRGRHSSLGGSGKAKNGDTAATGLALLAFLGHGASHIEEGPYRKSVARGLEWLVRQQKRDGDLRGGGNLYMHAVAAFALCEAYAFTRDPALEEPAQRAIDYTIKSQNPKLGSWRYVPYPEDDDIDTSVFGWMLMALKSGKIGGLDVDRRCLERGDRYLDSVLIRNTTGRYRYQPDKDRTSFAMTAQGFFCRQVLTETLSGAKGLESPRTRRSFEESTKYILANLPRAADMDGVNFYYWYYASLALFRQGGAPWKTWNAKLSRLLVEQQVDERYGSARGSWDPRGKRAETGGRLYSTAMSILCLEVYYRYGKD